MAGEKEAEQPEQGSVGLGARGRGGRLRSIFTGRQTPVPGVEVHILSGAHKTERDRKPLHRLMRSADILIPEAYGWTQAGLSVFQRLSAGEILPAQAVVYRDHPFGGRNITLAKAIHASNIPVTFIDEP